MPAPRRAGLLSAALLSVALITPSSAISITLDPDPAWRHSANVTTLAETLDGWLKDRIAYPRKAPPRIRIIDSAGAANLRQRSVRMSQRTRGLYDPEAQTIYLVAPWSPRDAGDVSVLLHELVHHRQDGARHWYCPGAQEPEAYRLQQAWLAERGLAMRINRIAVVLEAGCARRDIHPD